jgi:biotin carboxyl carrier protein
MTGLLQTLEHVALRSQIIEKTDPHGLIISAVSISAVFLALLILYLAYYIIGKCVIRLEERKILRDYPAEGGTHAPEDENHDKESYMITITRGQKETIKMPEAFSGSYNIHSDDADEGNTEKKVRTSEKGIIKSPLPGVIISLKASVGDKVAVGSELAVLEAMKMENTIESEFDGTVTEIYVSTGDSVLEGSPIMKIL